MLWVAPSIFLDPNAPSLWVPVVAIGSVVPLLVVGLAFGGYTQHINILLPTTARRSKEDLMRFASVIPPTTIVQIKSMWFRPWPVTKEIFFEDLRRLPRRWTRLANLEHVPLGTKEQAQKNPRWDWVAKSLMGRYFVDMTKDRDRSRAPGVWKRVWEQIPMSGEEPIKAKDMDRKPAVAANRPAMGAPTERRPPRRVKR